MNIRRKSKYTSEVSTSSLNDIMFFLLLFFLIASTMANPNVIKVLLPKAQGVQVQTKDKPLTLTINKEMEYFIENTPITREQVKQEIQKRVGTRQDPTVVLNIDGAVDWEYVAEVLDIGRELNVKILAAAKKK
ncbi:MAG: biopolymer transporter ExbD [Cytophagaceae bacterium]|nr:biopolymer transporter ExbD [Cytophagaceae bacterium]